MTPPLSEAQRMELLDIIREYEYPNDTTPYGKIFAYAKSQLTLPAVPQLNAVEERLRNGIAELYQVIGCLADIAGVFDDPQTIKALDWAANPDSGECDVLPFGPTPAAPQGVAIEVLSDDALRARRND